ncbi:acyl-CoA dehydrogenase family protein [Halorubellus salinus]|uniref:acyl-CoA dehydrogenase family protein n=1 Tax=Halorubellus salinus TaxID=755309 RepID=UPI001D08D5A1|nr:acyl-CoA dehydrogenase family protein [Halorubellus salinus]
MDFEFTEEQRLLQRTARDISAGYDLDYWREKDDESEFPHEVWDDLTDAGFVGMKIPTEYGGSGYGMIELVAASLEIARHGGGVSGANLLTSPVIGSTAIIEYGTDAQKERFLPMIAAGTFFAIGLTEPDAGLDTAGIKMTADRDGDEYVLNGTKIWTTGAHVADYIVTLARTGTGDAEKRHQGISLFIVPTDQDGLEVNKIDKLSMRCLSSFEVVYDDVRVPEENLIGDEGKGFFHVLGTLNTERINWGAIPIGAGELALDIAVDYAAEREAFERKIGQNQGVQFPLATSKAELETATLMLYKAAWLYDEGADCAMEANAAKLVGARAGFDAVDRAVQTLGGMGFADEYHVERLYRDVRLARVAPVSDELVKAYIAEHELDLPRSY